MIHGTVTAFKEATVPLRVMGPNGESQDLVGVLDIGFTAYLTLPREIIAVLNLASAGTTAVVLADGHDTKMGAFTASVLWDGVETPITVLEAEGDPLIGMPLLYGFGLFIAVVDGGRVEANRLAPSS